MSADQAPDEQLWRLVREGSVSAFETVVRRHQSVVSAVAYNICGNLALSEDVAQETFWAAWRERMDLQEPGKLAAWLCGIARNLARNAGRKAARGAGLAERLDAVAEPEADEPGPPEDAVSKEEEALVWSTLEQVPEVYREPLILFYREAQSVAEVAEALELSEDAVRQRLSRGRAMLRDRMATVVEEGLRRSRPGRKFTEAVIVGLTSNAAPAALKAAIAGAGGAKAALGAGLAGGVGGGLIGLAGGLAGAWAPAELAPTIRERDYLRRQAWKLSIASTLFLVVMIAPPLLLAGGTLPASWFVWGASMTAFSIYVLVTSLTAARQVARLRAEARPDEPLNDSALRLGVNAMTSQVRGRVYRSRASVLGWPLVDINVADPYSPGRKDRREGAGVARGWVAIGDEARGFLAIGGRAFGVLSFGGMAVGLVAFGGLALGVLSLGGGALGVLAIGGGAIGWQACGGGAIAWDVACGGGAIAWHAAFGGGAFAHDYALGGGGWARHFNDDAARAVLSAHPLKRGMDWFARNSNGIPFILLLVVSIVPSIAMPLLMYRREGPKKREPDGWFEV